MTDGMRRRPRLLYIVTVGITARSFLVGQLKAMDAAGFDVYVISSPEPQLEAFLAGQNARYLPIKMEREVSPLSDLRSLWHVWRTICKINPDIVNAGTPKAGLLGMIGAWVTRTPVRIYHLRGLRMETTHGLKRTILACMERVSAFCAQKVVCNSESLRQRYLELRLGKPEKAIVLGSGTSNGVDLRRFENTPTLLQNAIELRQTLGIHDDALVIGFVGRLVQDKGIEDLVKAFETVQAKVPSALLLLVGGLEQGDPLSAHVLEQIRTNDSILSVGFQSNAVPYYRLMNVLAFPSYREGFPNAPLEAAAFALPVVGYNVTGTSDAVVSGKTGILVPVGDVPALTASLVKLLDDATERHILGKGAHDRVESEFNAPVVWQNWIDLYNSLMGRKN